MIFPEIAYAQNASGGAQGGVLMTILPLLIMIAVFYFLVMRPQIKRERERQQMQSSLKRGDNVITSGGIIGKVSKLEDNQYVLVKLSEGVEVRMARSNIEGVVDAGIPTAQKTDKPASNKKPGANKNNSSKSSANKTSKTNSKPADGRSSNKTSGKKTSTADKS